ncbi:FAD binding domain protein [Aspergillus steynii IBT 23096]|uniref:FAD binding domain protein n=1 Tax=Aspergillus steynii IBT 23096 TaxID=1392250 RepID=A0A2I2G7X7_9EURO|nr:FAD binding domain protein [Aspergillus steynii IBT 23096]PLB48987.1 FAD binding domain protein [Aspergillus steynii IBT 23096]
MTRNIKAELNARLSASNVIVAGDDAWEDTLERWTKYRFQVPAAVIQPTNEDDVIEAVSYAVQNNRPFVVRGGGHSNGFSTISSPGVVIDLSRMRNVRVDVDNLLVTAQGGATMGDGIQVAGKAGLAIATGTCNEVGLVGATLGGGIGRFLGLWGYAIDTVVSMRVVVVDQSGTARAVEASREINPDLFWGLRGSGHLFGVVVEATFRAQPWHHDTWHSCLVFSPADAGMAAEAMDRIHYSGGMQGRFVFCAPNKQPVVLLQLWYVGSPDEAASKFDSLLSLPSMKEHPMNFVGHLIPYLNLNDSSDRVCGYAGRKNLAAFGMKSMSAEACDAALKVYMDFIHEHPEAAQTHILTEFYSMDVAKELDPYGQETSMSRDARQDVKYWVMPLAWYENASLDEDCARLNRDIREAFLREPDGKRANCVAYVNMPFEDDTARSVFGKREREGKLRELKTKWDPLGVIHGLIKFSE